MSVGFYPTDLSFLTWKSQLPQLAHTFMLLCPPALSFTWRTWVRPTSRLTTADVTTALAPAQWDYKNSLPGHCVSPLSTIMVYRFPSAGTASPA